MEFQQSYFEPRIRLGMVGGGEGAFIGAVHRLAARMDDRYEFLAGALCADSKRALQSGLALGLDPSRCYGHYEEMARAESERPDGIEAVVIVTPNHLHVPVARTFLEAGIHVICDKPLAANLEEVTGLQELAAQQQCLFAVTYNYSGYPLIQEARHRVSNGELGRIRVVQVEYPQDWLSTDLERSGHKQAEWRTDPARAGNGGSLGDIGTHAFHLACFVSLLTPEALLADLHSFVPGRQLDDNVHVLLRFAEGARGMLWVSQVAPGHENDLRLRIYGEKASLQWVQSEPNTLLFTPLGEPPQRLTRGGPGLSSKAARGTRVPAGLPEGYLEGFANLYTDIAEALLALRRGEPIPESVSFPGLDAGVDGMRFIEAALRSHQSGNQWVAWPDV